MDRFDAVRLPFGRPKGDEQSIIPMGCHILVNDDYILVRCDEKYGVIHMDEDIFVAEVRNVLI